MDGSQHPFDHRRGWQVNPGCPPGSPDAKAPYIDHGTDIVGDRRWYSCREHAAREWEGLWTKVWLLAGREADIAEPGQYFTFDIGPESIIVVRGEDQSIRAFYNVCQHRGNRLVHDDFGRVERFTCLFHAWQYQLDGRLCHITDSETFRPETIAHRPGLVPVSVDCWGGFVFISMADDPPPLLEFLDIIPEHMAPYRFQDMRVVKDVQSEWRANWKIGVEAFTESYHVHMVHPEILVVLDEYYQQYDCYGNGMSRMIAPFARMSPRLPDQDAMNDGLRAMLEEVEIDPDSFSGSAREVRAAVQEGKRRYAAKYGLDYSGLTDSQLSDDWNYFIFPNVTLNVHPEGVLVMRFRPHASDPEKLIYDITVLAHPAPREDYMLPYYMGVDRGADLSGKTRPARVYEPEMGPGVGYVLNQDAALVPTVQAGVRSRGYRGAIYSEQEVRLRHFHAELARYLRAV